MKEQAKYIRLDSLVKEGIVTETADLPPWEIPISWKSHEAASSNDWPRRWQPKRAFRFPDGRRMVYWNAEDNKGEEITRMYTLDRMGKRGAMRFKNIESLLKEAGISIP